MNVYQDLLSQFSVRESAVNCDKCVSPFKCCTYRPFVANFLAGKMLSLPVEDSLFEQWDLLIAGLAPSLSYRKLFFKKGKWGFGSDESLLCAFYEKKNGSCKVWSARPSVCKTFFCKSSYADQGMEYWKKTEEFSWRLEWVLLEDFLFEEGWTLSDVALIKNYLHEDYLKKPFQLPSELKFSSISEARPFYQKAQIYMESQAPERVQEILGLQGRQIYGDLVAERAKIR